MKPRLLIPLLLAFWATASQADQAILLTIDDAIGPATADYFIRGVEQANQEGAGLIILEMDTPGGLAESMRDMIQHILTSSVPVATYVSPSGSRAASAGTYILYASHVAAMAPATNLGSATPVPLMETDKWNPKPLTPASEEDGEAEKKSPVPSGSAMERKVLNDAVAYIRGLADLRNRNADWAEQAVVEAVNITATEALEKNVIDLIAKDTAELLAALDGRSVEVDGEPVTLATAGMIINRVEPDWRTRLLATITNPTVAAFLMLIGIYGLMMEGYNPGAVVPGVVGAIALLLALYAFQVLPVNYVGLGLIALGVILMSAEFFVPSFGALGIGGIVAFVVGSIILLDSDLPGFGVSKAFIGTVAAIGGLGVLAIIFMVNQMRKVGPVSGIEQMLGATAEVLEDFDGVGSVFIHGERWQAHSSSTVEKGQKVRVRKVDGLILEVEPVEN